MRKQRRRLHPYVVDRPVHSGWVNVTVRLDGVTPRITDLTAPRIRG